MHNNGNNPQIMLGFGSMNSAEIDRGIELLYKAWYSTDKKVSHLDAMLNWLNKQQNGG
jgi:hypothetical protein